MISFLIKHKNLFLILTILFFLGSLGFVGAGVFMEEYGPSAAVAYVGDCKIKYADYERTLRVAERNLRETAEDGEYTEEALAQLKQEVMQALINEESLSQSARKYGLGVSDIEVGYTIKSNFTESDLFNKQSYIWIVRNQFGMNPVEYETMIRKQKLAGKFQNMMILSAKVTPQEAQMFATMPAFKGAGLDGTGDLMSLAVLEIKAQSLLNSFTDQFNTKERVEIKDRAYL